MLAYLRHRRIEYASKSTGEDSCPSIVRLVGLHKKYGSRCGSTWQEQLDNSYYKNFRPDEP